MRGLAIRNARPCLRHKSLNSSDPSNRIAIRLLPHHDLITSYNTVRCCCYGRQCSSLLQVEAPSAFGSTSNCSFSRYTWPVSHVLQKRWATTVAVDIHQSPSTANQWHDSSASVPTRLDTTQHNQTIEGQYDNSQLEEFLIDQDDHLGSDVQESRTPDMQIADLIRYQRLLAKRLTLQLMMHLRVDEQVNRRLPSGQLSQIVGRRKTVDDIAGELGSVQSLIKGIDLSNLPTSYRIPQDLAGRRTELGNSMKELTEKLRLRTIGLSDFVFSFAQILQASQAAPSQHTYVLIMKALYQYPRYDTTSVSDIPQSRLMAKMVEETLWDLHENLENSTISSIVFRQGSDQDAARFLDLLERLLKKDTFPSARFSWYQRRLFDIGVSVPKSRNGYLMASLIRTSLCCRQDQLARAYADIFITRNELQNYNGKLKAMVTSAFLQSYAEWGNLRIGLPWLQKAVIWARYFQDAGDNVLGTVILRMLDFCAAIDCKAQYEAIMTAAIAAQIHLPPIIDSRPVTITRRMNEIRADWLNHLQDTHQTEPFLLQQTLREDAKVFQTMLEGKFETPEGAKSQVSVSTIGRKDYSQSVKHILTDGTGGEQVCGVEPNFQADVQLPRQSPHQSTQPPPAQDLPLRRVVTKKLSNQELQQNYYELKLQVMEMKQMLKEAQSVVQSTEEMEITSSGQDRPNLSRRLEGILNPHSPKS